jgi:MoxR-like ATPase
MHAESDAQTNDTIDAATIERVIERLNAARREVGKVVYGQADSVQQLLVAMMCGGHVLIEGAPGLGKTLLVRTLASVCGLHFARIQFTPDLMPADITGATVLVHDEHGHTHAQFQPGPIFAQLVLADEVNRTTPKTQSALLEAMQERTVTAGGRVHELPRPFFVLATQNPIEMEGTYVLPEAQIDRFLLKIAVPFPSAQVLDDIITGTTGGANVEPETALTPDDLLEIQRLTRAVPIAEHVRRTVVEMVLASQRASKSIPNDVARHLRFGITPRGAQSLALAAKGHALLSGRYQVSFDDVEAMLPSALRHRVQLTYEAAASGVTPDAVLKSLYGAAVKHLRA